MLYASEDVQLSFNEVPGELSLLIPFSGCGLKCPSCHSSYLQDPSYGVIFNTDTLHQLIQKYKSKPVSCICFMGGTNFYLLAHYLTVAKEHGYRTGWYTGLTLSQLQDKIVFIEHPGQVYHSTTCPYFLCDYIKTGPYIPERGGLENPLTNQRFFHITHHGLCDQTALFWQSPISSNFSQLQRT
jgi:anaerobic ribonucleoside-triphosphate reductase activating protein